MKKLTEERSDSIFEFDDTIDNIIEKLQKWKSEGIVAVKVCIDSYNDQISLDLMREETEAEEIARIRREEKKLLEKQAIEDLVKEAEYNKYLELKKKFEKGVT
jgi:hypothetical protein